MLRAELTPIVVRCIVVCHSVCSSHGFIVPDLTRTEHRVHGTSETPSGSDASDLPAEPLPDEFVGLRQPAVGRVRDVAHDGPDEGAPQPTVGPGGDRSVSDRPEP